MENIKLWDWAVRVKDTSCKATYTIKGLKLMNAFLFQCTCLTDTSCFATYKMESYCLKCKKNAKNIDPTFSSSSNGRAMILSKCAICSSKNSRLN